MQIEFSKASASLNLAAAKKPSITGATRLETQPTAVSLKTGLQAPLADPLWLLARQWQFNEFQGEDAGTPLVVKFAVNGRPVDSFRAGHDSQQPWETLQPGGVPLEARVEAEAAWKTHPRLRGEAGLQALRMAPNAAVRSALLDAYALRIDPPTDPDADHAGLVWSTLFDRRTVDAAKLLADLAPLADANGRLASLPAALNVAVGDVDAARSMLEAWLAWAGQLVYEGNAASGPDPSWRPERMEYAFSVASGTVGLTSDEYTDGHVDWEDFRATALPAQAAPPAPPAQSFAVARRHPAPVRYPGMPAERYWEFEDADVNFAGAEAGVTDLLRLTVTEFALTFGNDWFIVPVRLPVGALYDVSAFEVTDTFGITAHPGPIQVAGPAPWTMFEVSADVNLQGTLRHAVLIPDSLDGVQEGAVLEHTLLARDEMANLAWAIEKKVQGVSGEPLDRELEAKGLAFHQQIQFDSGPQSPQLVYRLATPVPANWTPLLPVRDPRVQSRHGTRDSARARGNEALLSRSQRRSDRRRPIPITKRSSRSSMRRTTSSSASRSAPSFVRTCSILAAGCCGAIPRSRWRPTTRS